MEVSAQNVFFIHCLFKLFLDGFSGVSVQICIKFLLKLLNGINLPNSSTKLAIAQL